MFYFSSYRWYIQIRQTTADLLTQLMQLRSIEPEAGI